MELDPCALPQRTTSIFRSACGQLAATVAVMQFRPNFRRPRSNQVGINLRSGLFAQNHSDTTPLMPLHNCHSPARCSARAAASDSRNNPPDDVRSRPPFATSRWLRANSSRVDFRNAADACYMYSAAHLNPVPLLEGKFERHKAREI